MRIEDIDKEFKELGQSLKEAESAFSQGNYAQAEPLYKRALELLEKSYDEEHSDIYSCLQNLGDTYYSLRKYSEAVPIFRRLLILKERQFGIAHHEVAGTLFKLAKSYEKLGMSVEAESIYRRALRVAEQSESIDVAFIANILESFASMLRRAGRRMQDAEAMEEKARDIREFMAKPTKPPNLSKQLLEQLAASIPSGSAETSQAQSFTEEQDQETEQEAYDREQSAESWDNQRLRSLRSVTARKEGWHIAQAVQRLSKWHIFAVFLVIVVVAVSALEMWPLLGQGEQQIKSAWALINQMAEKRTHEAKTSPSMHVFTSLDGRKKVTLIGEKEAQLTLRGAQLKGDYVSDLQTIAITPQSGSAAYRFRKTDVGLIDSEGTVLYAPDASEILVAEQMKFLAMVAQRYYRQFHEYPNQTEYMLSGEPRLAYRNPFSGQTVVPVKRNVLQNDLQESIGGMSLSDYAQLENVVHTIYIWQRRSSVNPGSVEFFHIMAGPEGDSFFIRGTDRDGQLLTGSAPGTAFVITLVQGRLRK